MELVGEVRTWCPCLCPLPQLQPSCTTNWTSLAKVCPPVPLSGEWQSLWTIGTKDLTAILFSSATMRFTQAHLQGFRAHFNSRDPCIWLSEAHVGCPHLLVTDCEKCLQNQLLPLLTHGNKENSLVLVFCLDLSRLNRAAWDSKDKMESLFAFHCDREMFSHRFNSWSPQMLFPGSSSRNDQKPNVLHVTVQTKGQKIF